MSPSPSATGGLPTDFVSLPWGGVDWPDIQNQHASIDRSVDAMKCEKRRSGKQHFGPSINASPIPSLPLPALLPFPPSLLPQRLPVALSVRSVGVESVGNRFARRWPGTIPSTRFLVPPSSPPIQHYSGAAYSFPNTIPPLYVPRGRGMPENDAGSATRLTVTDDFPAPKPTIQLLPSFARDSSDVGIYRSGTFIAPGCEFSRLDIRFFALTTHTFTHRRNPRFPALPCARFIRNGRRLVGIARFSRT